MGRRSINTTKSGKYMNPTDQARKEARKKELKKNKKQRQMVRAAVLKGKDPAQIIEEMEKIDEMEYNVFEPSPLNEKVLKEKRKKLKETLDRIMRLYHTDDPEVWAELKRKEVDYEKHRNKKVQYFESVKYAQSVQIDDIPLPQATDTATTVATVSSTIPTPSLTTMPPARVVIPAPLLGMPAFVPPPPQNVLKKLAEVNVDEKRVKPILNASEPPGCPPGPPPDLMTMPELDTDSEDDPPSAPKKSRVNYPDEAFSDSDGPAEQSSSEEKTKTDIEDSEITKPTSLQQRMLALSGQNIDEFMKEMESVQKRKEQERNNAELKEPKAAPVTPQKEKIDPIVLPPPRKDIVQNIISVPPPMSVPLTSGPPPVSIGIPPAMLFRPPPMRPPVIPGIQMRMPPNRQGMQPMGPPPRVGIRMPPGPPPGPPPRMMHQQKNGHMHNQGMSFAGGVKEPKSATIISAKPQIRNLSADVTRFVPSTLRVKREDKQKPKYKSSLHEFKQQQESVRGPTKDDAYMQFMNEMKGLL